MRHPPSIPSLLPLICGILACPAPLPAEPTTVHPAVNTDPSPGPPGAKPYEMAGRSPDHPTLFDFTDVSGWEVEGHEAEGWLYTSQEQQLFEDRCGKLVYVGSGRDPWLLVRPASPMPIPEPWDAISFWTYGNNWSWVPDPKTPPLHVAALLLDSAGGQFAVDLGRIDYTYWFMMHGRLGREHRGRPRPFQLVGLRFTNGRNTEQRTVYLGPISFYQEDLKPLTFDPWPDRLPFPAREETILPMNKTRDFRNAARREGEATVFSYEGGDCSLEYRWTPRDGTLGDIE